VDYPNEHKQAAPKKVHPPINKRIPEIAKEEGISEATLLTTIDGLRFPHCLGELCIR
jgi:hypothetical protein